jgi:serralysin
MRTRIQVSLLLTLLAALPAQAGHHQWFISEIFTNADGSVQFVELKGTADNEQFINGFNVATLGPEGVVASSAPLGPNLTSNLTNGAYLLIGSAGYAALAATQGAPAPDRTLPNGFLELTGDRVRYAGILATDRFYTSGGIPVNGVFSLDYEVGSPGTTYNTPQNFAGQSGAINASGPSVPSLSRVGIIALIGCLVMAMALKLRHRTQGAAA